MNQQQTLPITLRSIYFVAICAAGASIAYGAGYLPHNFMYPGLSLKNLQGSGICILKWTRRVCSINI